jgi:hypothetical protein
MIEGQPVSIITFGVGTPEGKALFAHIKENDAQYYPPIDIRDHFYGGHKKLADDTVTAVIANLLEDKRFYNVCRAVAEVIEHNADAIIKTLPLFDQTGDWSDGIAKAVAHRVFNNQMRMNSDGIDERVYNVRVFGPTQKTDAYLWLESPWNQAGIQLLGSPWGQEQADTSLRAHTQIECLLDLSAMMNGQEPPHSRLSPTRGIIIELVSDDDQEEPSVEPPTGRPARGSVGSSNKMIAPTAKTKPNQPS